LPEGANQERRRLGAMPLLEGGQRPLIQFRHAARVYGVYSLAG
jgi:hypothetical protein